MFNIIDVQLTLTPVQINKKILNKLKQKHNLFIPINHQHYHDRAFHFRYQPSHYSASQLYLMHLTHISNLLTTTLL